MTGRVDDAPRKDHYGTGRQPWDDTVDAGWGAQACAFNVLRYLRRPNKMPPGFDTFKIRLACTIQQVLVPLEFEQLEELFLTATRQHSLESARWYWHRLKEMCAAGKINTPMGVMIPMGHKAQATQVLRQLNGLLTHQEMALLEPGK